MNGFEQVFNYCERGTDPSFWAEPVNAWTNAGFLVAAMAAAMKLARTQRAGPEAPAGDIAVLGGMIALVIAIGTGSFLFHTFATRWALVADVAPITVFTLAYLVYALKRFLGWGWPAVGLAVPAFLLAGSLASGVTCPTWTGPASVDATTAHAVGAPCLNGSLGYLPALIALWGTALAARHLGLGSWKTLFVAAGVLSVSLGFRTVDLAACGALLARGTHGAWHLLNAGALYLLLSAAIERSFEPRERDPG